MDIQQLQTQIDNMIADYPVCQYALVDVSDICFSEKVRAICRTECERYGTSWSCPPGVGEVRACREKCLSYEKALVFTTMAEVSDSSILSEALATRGGHEKVIRALCADLQNAGYRCLPLSSESCQICDTCAYPNPCRHPEYAIPCVESFGILVTDIAEKCGISFYTDIHTVTWFGIIFLSSAYTV